MILYTFYCWRPGAETAFAFEAHEHRSDEIALAFAQEVLIAHSTCDRVEVFDGDRRVGAVGRG